MMIDKIIIIIIIIIGAKLKKLEKILGMRNIDWTMDLLVTSWRENHFVVEISP